MVRNHLIACWFVVTLSCTFLPTEEENPSKDEGQPEGRLISASGGGSIVLPEDALVGSDAVGLAVLEPSAVGSTLEELELPLELPEGGKILASLELTLGESGETVQVKKMLSAALAASTLPADDLPPAEIPAAIAAGQTPAARVTSNIKALTPDETTATTAGSTEEAVHLLKSFYLLIGPKGNLLSAPLRGELTWDAEEATVLAQIRPELFPAEGVPGGTRLVIVLVLLQRGHVIVRLAGRLLDELEPGFVAFVLPEEKLNRPPKVASTLSYDVPAGERRTLTLAVDDPDGDTVTITAYDDLPAFVLLEHGHLTVEPGASDTGSFSFRLAYRDDGTPPATTLQTVTVTVTAVDEPETPPVNRAPTVPTTLTYTVAEGREESFVLAATDPDGDQVTILPGEDLPGFVTLHNNLLLVAPGFANGGSYSFTLLYQDDRTPPASTTQTVTLTVTEVNQSPVLTTIPDHTLRETEHLSVLVTATDPDGDTLTYSFPDGLPSFVTFVQGHLALAPGPGDAGSYVLTVTVSDDGTPILTDTQTFALEVSPYPQVVAFTPLTIGNDASFSFESNVLEATFLCILDGSVVVNPCTSPHVVTDLTPGSHTFEVTATAFDLVSGSTFHFWDVAAPPDFPPPSTEPFVAVQWLSHHPSGADLHAVHGDSSSDVWAVGCNGQVLHYNGQTWHGGPAASALVDFWHVFSLGPQHALAVGYDDRNNRNTLYSCYAPEEVYCLEAFIGHPFLGDISDLWADGPGDIYLTGLTYGITLPSGVTALPYVLRFQGSNLFDPAAWTYHTPVGDVTADLDYQVVQDLPPFLGDLTALTGESQGPGLDPYLVVASAGGELFMAEGTDAWVPLATASDFDPFMTGEDLGINALWLDPVQDTLYLGGHDSSWAAAAFVFDGTSWAPVSTDLSHFDGSVSAVGGVPGQDPYWLTGWNGTVVQASDPTPLGSFGDLVDGGSTWGLWVTPDNGNLYGVGPGGALLTYDGDFVNRATGHLNSGSPGYVINDVFALGPDAIFAGGQDGLLLRYNLGTWHTYLNGINNFVGVAALDADNAAAVCLGGAVFTYTSATDWIQSATPLCSAARWYTVTAFPDYGYLAAGEEGMVVTFGPTGDCTSLPVPPEITSQHTFHAIAGDNSSDFFVVGNHGAILHYHDATVDLISPPGSLSDPDTMVWSSIVHIPVYGGLDAFFISGKQGATPHLFHYWDGGWIEIPLVSTTGMPFEPKELHLDSGGWLWILSVDSSLYVFRNWPDLELQFFPQTGLPLSSLHGVGATLYLGGMGRTVLSTSGYNESE